MQVSPYLYFNGRCEEALNFYKNALGAEVINLIRLKESAEPELCLPGAEEKIMHASFKCGETIILASDGKSLGAPAGQGFSLSLSVKDQTEAQRYFSALSEGGEIQMPLSPTFWSSCFGVVEDKFQISWMITVENE